MRSDDRHVIVFDPATAKEAQKKLSMWLKKMDKAGRAPMNRDLFKRCLNSDKRR